MYAGNGAEGARVRAYVYDCGAGLGVQAVFVGHRRTGQVAEEELVRTQHNMDGVRIFRRVLCIVVRNEGFRDDTIRTLLFVYGSMISST